MADIESALSGSPASIKSPDFLPDVDTGEMREVDAVMRVNAGSTSVLVAFECRKRSVPQDVTWIEQLIAKRQSLKLDKLIAVSEKGFTAAAKTKAEKYGIELRQISQMKAVALDTLRDKIKVTGFGFPTLLRGISVRLGVGQQPHGIATAQFNKNIQELGLKMTFGHRYSNDEPINLQDFVQQTCITMLQELLELREKVSTLSLDVEFSEAPYYYLVESFKYPIKKVLLQLDLKDGIIPVQITAASTYIKSGEKFGGVLQTEEIQLDNGAAAQLTVVFTKDKIHSHATFNLPK